MEYQEILTEEEKQLLNLYRRATTDVRRFAIYGMEAVENLKEYHGIIEAFRNKSTMPVDNNDI